MTNTLRWAMPALFLSAAFLAQFGFRQNLTAMACAVAASAGSLWLSRSLVLSLVSFLPAFACAAWIWRAEGAEAGVSAALATTLGFWARSQLLLWSGGLERKNGAFADVLRSALPTKADVYVDIDLAGEVERGRLVEGATVRMRPNEPLPADGVVSFGSSFVDESIFGNPEPQPVGMGSRVFAGSRNGSASFLYKAEGGNSAIERLADALVSGLGAWAPGRPFRLMDIGLAAAIVFSLWRGGGPETLLNVFLASGAAGLAASLRIRDSSLVARSAATGIAWGSRAAVAKIARAGAFVVCPGALFDRRLRFGAFHGTLGEPALLRMLAPLARKRESQEAYALLLEARLRNIPLEQIEISDGKARLGDDEIEWLDDAPGLDAGGSAEFAAERRSAGERVVFLKLNGAVAGAVSFTATPLGEAWQTVETLRTEDVPLVLATPNPRAAAERAAMELDIAHVHPESDAKSLRLLLEKLAGDGLSPVYIRSLDRFDWDPVGPWARIGELTDPRPADAKVLRADLPTATRAWILAARYEVSGQWALLSALAFQTLLCFSGLSALWLSLGALLAAAVVAGLSYRLRIIGLESR